MNELYDDYYETTLSQSDSQRLDRNAFERARRKYSWNYRRFFKKISPQAAILDIGCGVGQFLYYLYHCGYRHITGIDLSEKQIQLARDMQPDLDFRCVAEPSAFLKDHQEHFDVIVLNDLIEHLELETLLSLLKGLFLALKPNGRVIIKTINAAYPLGNSARYQDLTHRMSFHEKSLTQLLRHCGFTSIQCFQEEIGIYNPLFAIKKAVVNTVRLLLKLLVYFSEADWPGIVSVNIIACARKDGHD